MAIYSDILMENDDIAIDRDNQAVIIEDRAVILQDLIHAIRESGYLVEEDTRIIPGSVNFTGDGEQWILTAETYEFGAIRSPVWISKI